VRNRAPWRCVVALPLGCVIAGCHSNLSWFEPTGEALPNGTADPIAALVQLAAQGVYLAAQATGEFVVGLWREAWDSRVPGVAWDSPEGQQLRHGHDH
jgi:hypothetical protein